MVILLLSQSILCLFILHLGTPLEYYLFIQMPLVIVECVIFIKELDLLTKTHDVLSLTQTRLRIILSMSTCLALIAAVYLYSDVHVFYDNFNLLNDENDYEMYLAMNELYSHIPENEKNDIMCVETGTRFFEMTGAFPINKYPYNTSYLGSICEPVRQDIFDSFEKESHKWLFTEMIPENANQSFYNMIDAHYENVSGDNYMRLYRRR